MLKLGEAGTFTVEPSHQSKKQNIFLQLLRGTGGVAQQFKRALAALVEGPVSMLTYSH